MKSGCGEIFTNVAVWVFTSSVVVAAYVHTCEPVIMSLLQFACRRVLLAKDSKSFKFVSLSVCLEQLPCFVHWESSQGPLQLSCPCNSPLS